MHIYMSGTPEHVAHFPLEDTYQTIYRSFIQKHGLDEREKKTYWKF